MGLFPMTGKVFRGGKACLLGADLALRHVNDREDLLENYSLNLIWKDSKVHITKTYPCIIQRFLKLKKKNENFQ